MTQKAAASTPLGLSAPYFDGREEELVLEVLRSGRLSLGPMVDRFETLFAERVEALHATAVSSGTAGLHLAVHLAGVGPGDEVITSPFSFVASANCAIYEGATPVFADIDPATLNLDPGAVEAAITERTRAVVAVDIFGYPCELDPLQEICERHGLVLIEDSCEALGATYKGRPIGSHGHLAVFAFYPNKQMTTGEGGVVVTALGRGARAAREPRQPGSGGLGRLARARAARLQLPALGRRSGARRRQLEKLDLLLPLRSAAPRATRSCSRTYRAPSLCSPTTRITRARGSSIPSGLRRRSTAST